MHDYIQKKDITKHPDDEGEGDVVDDFVPAAAGVINSADTLFAPKVK
jgi:hypothetical protein